MIKRELKLPRRTNFLDTTDALTPCLLLPCDDYLSSWFTSRIGGFSSIEFGESRVVCVAVEQRIFFVEIVCEEPCSRLAESPALAVLSVCFLLAAERILLLRETMTKPDDLDSSN